MSDTIEYKDLQMEGGAEEATVQVTQGKIAGYAMVYGNVDDVGDRAHMGCAAKSVATASGMPVGWQHDIKNPFGVTLDAAEHPRSQLPSFVTTRFPDATGGLWVKGQAVMTPDNKQRMELVVQGPVKGLSVGYIPKVFNYTKEAEATVRNLMEIDWKEWSPVTIGANPAALMTEVKGSEGFAGSYEDRRSRVQDALTVTGLLGADYKCSVIATFQDDVLVECRKKKTHPDGYVGTDWDTPAMHFEVGYAINATGQITFGGAKQVTVLRTYSPMVKAWQEYDVAMSTAFLELKEGRMLSASTLKKIGDACDGIGGGHSSLVELMGLAEKGKKESSSSLSDTAFEQILRGRKWRMDMLTAGRV